MYKINLFQVKDEIYKGIEVNIGVEKEQIEDKLKDQKSQHSKKRKHCEKRSPLQKNTCALQVIVKLGNKPAMIEDKVTMEQSFSKKEAVDEETNDSNCAHNLSRFGEGRLLGKASFLSSSKINDAIEESKVHDKNYEKDDTENIIISSEIKEVTEKNQVCFNIYIKYFIIIPCM